VIISLSKRQSLRLAALFLVTLAFTAGCHWWAGTVELDPDYAHPEIHTMTEKDATDTVFSDGKVYTVDVVIEAAPGTIPYKFVFADDTRQADTAGATERRLTIN